MDKKIAIIGVSIKFPDAENMKDFHWNLLRKKNSIRDFDDDRKKLLNLEKENYFKIASIKGIDEFDNDFFGISNREAKAMSPEMRISLEQAVMAFWDAGYSLEEIKGSNCGVIVSQSGGNYKNYLDEYNAFSFIGNQPAMTSGNIAYHLDLRGPNMLLSSTCSSSLLSIHEAAVKLYTQQADMMLVGGAEISIPDNNTIKEMNSLGIISEFPKCTPFSSNASGTQNGEGAAFIVLKRFEDAVKDNDCIYGCILSSAVNGNGERSGNLTAPSADAESEVIEKAWSSAGIDSSCITEIEAHGTATKVGDPIEAEGICRCLNDKQHNRPIYLSSVKSNIGHLVNMAGIASLVKVLTGFENNVCYPICGLDNVNPALSFSETRVMPLKEPVFYSKNDKRVAGISAYGFSGNNVHIVVQNVLDKTEISNEPDSSNQIIKISVKNESCFDAYVRNLCDALQDLNTDVNDFIYTLNIGRDDYEYRAITEFGTRRELIDKISCLQPQKVNKENKSVICIFKHENNSLCKNAHVKKFIEKEFQTPEAEKCGKLVIDAAIICVLKILGIEFSEYVCDEYGKLVKQLAENPKELDKICAEYNKLKNAEIDNSGDNGVSFNIGCTVVDLLSYDGIEKSIEKWYCSGGKINWKNYYENTKYKRCHLPHDILVRKKLWGISDNKLEEDIINVNTQNQVYENSEICKKTPGNPVSADYKTIDETAKNSVENLSDLILSAWKKALDDSNITVTDSFFELGGNSLTAMMIIDELNSQLETELTVEDFYEYDNIEQLVKYIKGEINE